MRRYCRLQGLLLALSLAVLAAPLPQLTLCVPAVAQSADQVTLTDITIDTGAVTYRMPRVEIRGGNLSEAEAKSLFDSGSGIPVVQRVARLQAREVSIPQLAIEQPLGTGRHTTTYRDILLAGVADGRVASVVAGGGGFDTKGIETGGRGRFGRLAATDVDVVQSLTIASEKAGPGPQEYRRLYASLSLDSLEADGANGAGFRIGRMAARDLKARPTAESWAETIKLLGDIGQKGKLPDDQQARALSLSADLLDAIEIGSFEFADFETLGQKPSEPQVRIARLSYAAAQPGRGAEARLDGFETTGPEATARIASLAFSDFSFAQTMAGLRELGGKNVAAIDPRDLRKLIPTIGTIRLAGLDFDAPGAKKEGGAKDPPIRVGLRSMEFAAEKPINGVPTGIRLALDNLIFPLPAEAEEDVIKTLAALGYNSADLSTRIAAAWTEATGELALRDVSIRGANMGSIGLRGVFGNVGRDIFDADTAIASVALVAATLKTLEINVENSGLAEKFLALQAAGQKRSAEDVRREFGMTAAVGIPALLGNSAQAKALGSAIARFIAKPNRLAITARARDVAGLGASDLALIGDPNVLMGKIDLTAKAE